MDLGSATNDDPTVVNFDQLCPHGTAYEAVIVGCSSIGMRVPPKKR